MKIRDPKIFYFLIPFVVIVGLIANPNMSDPIDFEIDGNVVLVSWEGNNHGMPLLMLKQNDSSGTIRKFENNDIILKPEQIKVGDKFKKLAGYRICEINSIEIQCIK